MTNSITICKCESGIYITNKDTTMQSAVSGKIKAWCDMSDVTSPSNNPQLINVTKDYIVNHPNSKAVVKKCAAGKRNYLGPFLNVAYLYKKHSDCSTIISRALSVEERANTPWPWLAAVESMNGHNCVVGLV